MYYNFFPSSFLSSGIRLKVGLWVFHRMGDRPSHVSVDFLPEVEEEEAEPEPEEETEVVVEEEGSI